MKHIKIILLLIPFLFFAESSAVARLRLPSPPVLNSGDGRDDVAEVLTLREPEQIRNNLRRSFVAPEWFFNPYLPTNEYQERVDRFKERAPEFARQLTEIRNNFVTPDRHSEVRRVFNKLNHRYNLEQAKLGATVAGTWITLFTVYQMAQPFDPTPNKLITHAAMGAALLPFSKLMAEQVKQFTATNQLVHTYLEHIVTPMGTSTPMANPSPVILLNE